MTRWDAAAWGPMSLASIRALYVEYPGVRISPHTYPPGTTFPVLTREGTCYALQGACEYTFADGRKQLLSAGAYATIPAGQHTFRVLGDVPFACVMAWVIRERVT